MGATQVAENINKLEGVDFVPTRYREVVLNVSR
jgi:hypothetical protein